MVPVGTSKVRTFEKLCFSSAHFLEVPLNNKLIFVNNQYNLKSSGDTYVISNSNLQEIDFKEASSIEIIGATANIDTKNSDGSVRYKLELTAQNTGLFTADGFEYNGKIMQVN